MQTKILIGCPTYDGQEYCLERFIESLKQIQEKCDILFVDNSKNNEYYEKLKNIKINDKKIIVIKDRIEEDTRISKIISSRNKVRQFFLKQNYSHLLFLDSDIICPGDTISKLGSCKSDIASGVYLCRQNINGQDIVLPTLYAANDNNSARTISIQEIIENKIMSIAVCGLGCCLIKKNVLSILEFRPYSDSNTGGEDVAFCLDAKSKEFSLKANTQVKCEHVGKNEVLKIKTQFTNSFTLG